MTVSGDHRLDVARLETKSVEIVLELREAGLAATIDEGWFRSVDQISPLHPMGESMSSLMSPTTRQPT